MIEKLYDETDSLVIEKINEIIDEVNKFQNHFHHARELQYGTDSPAYPIKREEQ